MTITDIFEGARFVASVNDITKDQGMTLQVGSDFTEYANLVAKYRPEQPLGLPFDCKKHFIKPANGFWIVGWNQQGELVHTQAMRLIDLAGVSLAEYLQERFTDFPPPVANLDLPRSRYHPGPSAKKILGTACYHGDLWLKGGEGGYRSKGMPTVLARLALVCSMLRWAPDHVFGFMVQPVAFKGLAEREGYMHSEPGSLFWHYTDSNIITEVFTVWMRREDISHILKIPLATLIGKAADLPAIKQCNKKSLISAPDLARESGQALVEEFG